MTIELTHELGQNFINYAMAVNSDRAIPDAATGLKPVHKRILYCAFDEGHLSSKKYVKCANNVGNMLAYWHPHGDSSVYGALVRLAQPWIMRYPLIDFHGNVGSQSGDGPAAYRYTEYRLSKISEEGLLEGIKNHAIEFIPNFDETRDEPKNLYSIFPNLLCNPNSGIAVGLACSWAPHNLKEVANAIYEYLDNKPLTPIAADFPTGGIIINKNDIPNIMETGKGTLKIRAKYKLEKNNIVFYEIPYGVSTEDVIQELNDLAQTEKLIGVSHIRDESNKEGLRIVLEVTKECNMGHILNLLFQFTSLQSSFSYNQVALVDKEPKLLNLKDCIEIYIKHNIECILREHTFELEKKQARKHIIDGFVKALTDIDNIIAEIKNSNSSIHAKERLKEKYGFSEEQAKAIIDMKLGRLANLEKVEVQNEQAELEKRIEKLNTILSSKEEQILILRERLQNIVQKYGDKRRTELVQLDIQKEKKEPVVIEPKDCVVLVAADNTVKRVDRKNFKTQRRNTVGIRTKGEITVFSQKTNTQDYLMVFTNKGRVYKVLVDNIPENVSTSLLSLIEFQKDEIPITYTTLTRDSNKQFILFTTKKGMIKKVSLSEYGNLKKSGVLTIKFKDNDDEIVNVSFVNQEHIILLTKNGMGIKFAADDLPISSRIAMGVKGINLSETDEVVTTIVIENSNAYLMIVTENNFGKKIKFNELPLQARAGKGNICSKEKIVTGILIKELDNILVIGNNSSVVINEKDIPLMLRNSLGNIMLKGNTTITSIAKI